MTLFPGPYGPCCGGSGSTIVAENWILCLVWYLPMLTGDCLCNGTEHKHEELLDACLGLLLTHSAIGMFQVFSGSYTWPLRSAGPSSEPAMCRTILPRPWPVSLRA